MAEIVVRRSLNGAFEAKMISHRRWFITAALVGQRACVASGRPSKTAVAAAAAAAWEMECAMLDHGDAS